MPSFHELEMKFGMAAAYQVLSEIEKMAGILCEERVAIDPEVRLANAVRAQDALQLGWAA